MSPVTKKWLQVLEARFGVSHEFGRRLAPFLDRFAAQEPTPEEWEQTLRAIAAAHRSCAFEDSTLEDVQDLFGQFVLEVKKLDETLQVLGTYVERIRKGVHRPVPGRVLH